MSEKPEKKFNAGAISATIWNNETKNKSGEEISFRTIQLQRSYQDKEGNWQNTNSMRVNDIPKATLVLNKAYEYLLLKDPALQDSSQHNSDNISIEEVR